MENKFCPMCGSAVQENELACPMCGSLFSSEKVVVKRKVNKPRDKKLFRGKNISFLIKNFLLLLVSSLILLFSFLPVYSVKFDYGYYDEINMKISSVNSIGFFFDSLKNYELDEYEDTLLYEKYEELGEELEEEFEDFDEDDKLTRKQKNLIGKFIKLTLRLGFSSEDFYTPGYMPFAAVTSIASIGLAIALFVLSLLNFIFLMVGKRGAFFKSSLILLLLTSIATVINYTAIKPFGTMSILENGSDNMAFSAVAIIVLSLAYIAYSIVERCVALKKSISVAKIVKNAVSLACAVVIICLSFAPVLSTDIKTTFKGSDNKSTVSAKIDPEYFAMIGVSIDSDMFEGFSESNAGSYLIDDTFGNFKKLEVRRGEADLVNYNFLTSVISTAFLGVPAFHIIFFVTVLMIISAALIAMQNILYLCTGNKSVALVIIFKVLCIIAAAVILGMLIGYSVIANISASEYLDISKCYKVKLAAAPIISLIIAIGMACVPSKDVTVVYINEDEVDDESDVAFANE